MIKLNDKSKIASIDVDAQYSFTSACPEELPVPNGIEIVNELNQQASLAQYRIGTKDAHSQKAMWVTNNKKNILSPLSEVKHADVHWPVHCVPGTKGFENLAGLPHPADYDFFVWKGIELDMHPYGACYHDLAEKLSTGIIEFLQNKKVDTVIVGGLATDYCVKDTVLQLLNAGFKTIVNLGACRGLDPHTTRDAIQTMQQKGAIIIPSTQTLQQKEK